jgi:hypothetical protein
MHRASNLDDAPGGRVHYACATTTCVVHSSAVCATAANPHAPPLFPSRAARPRGASRSAAGCPCRFYTPRAARTKLRCAFDAPIISNGLFRPFRTPQNLGGGRPLAGLCSSAVRSGWAGQDGGRQQEGGRRGGEGPFLSTLNRFGLRHCERLTQSSVATPVPFTQCAV